MSIVLAQKNHLTRTLASGVIDGRDKTGPGIPMLQVVNVRLLPFWFKYCIDLAGACGNDRHCNQIAASAHYTSGRHIDSAMGKRGGQALVSKHPAAKICSRPRASFGVGANNGSAEDAQGLLSGDNASGAAVAELSTLSRSQLEASASSLGVVHRDGKTRKTRGQIEEDCRLALQAQQSQAQQEGRRSGHALGAAVAKSPALTLCQLIAQAKGLGVDRRDESNKQKTRAQLKADCLLALQEARLSGSESDVGGASFGGVSSLSAAPVFGRDAERTKTVPGYAGASMHTASTAANIDAEGLSGVLNAFGAAVTELSQMKQDQLRAKATSLGVAHRDESNKPKTVAQLKKDCRLALEAQHAKVQQEGRRSGSALDFGGSSLEGASSLSAAPACALAPTQTQLSQSCRH